MAFVERHGYALLFVWVLAEQGGVPLPSLPLLLAVGALIRTGKLHLVPAMLSCIAASLIADTIWFALGRSRGRQVLKLLCRVSLEPDSCVRQTENAFVKYGMRLLLIAKLVPGLNSVAAPLAGYSRNPYIRFALYDSAGILIWSGAYVAIGYVFSEQLETVLAYAARLGSNLVLLVVALFAAWIVWKFVQRRRFLRQLEVARITPAELHEKLSAGEPVFIVDLRNVLAGEPDAIPGAVRISPEELAAHSERIPRDRDIILFCT